VCNEWDGPLGREVLALARSRKDGLYDQKAATPAATTAKAMFMLIGAAPLTPVGVATTGGVVVAGSTIDEVLLAYELVDEVVAFATGEGPYIVWVWTISRVLVMVVVLS
jgi:hypothetical protein